MLVEAADRIGPLAAATHRVEVDFELESAPVLADRDRLLTIVTNLMDNAVKYSPEGGRVEVSLTARAGTALVTVRDHGLGIAAADLPRLFTRFGRIVTTGNSHIPGTGLGLYLAREVARMHGGDITVESEEGVGSTFVLTLPMVVERHGDAVRSASE